MKILFYLFVCLFSLTTFAATDYCKKAIEAKVPHFFKSPQKTFFGNTEDPAIVIGENGKIKFSGNSPLGYVYSQNPRENGDSLHRFNVEPAGRRGFTYRYITDSSGRLLDIDEGDLELKYLNGECSVGRIDRKSPEFCHDLHQFLKQGGNLTLPECPKSCTEKMLERILKIYANHKMEFAKDLDGKKFNPIVMAYGDVVDCERNPVIEEMMRDGEYWKTHSTEDKKLFPNETVR